MKLITSSISVLLLSLVASAAPITFSGTTTGTFKANGTNTWKGITYTGASFTGTTDANGKMMLTNLGSFTRGDAAKIDSGNQADGFKLDIDFDTPGDDQTYSFNASFRNWGYNGFYWASLDVSFWSGAPYKFKPLEMLFDDALGTTTATAYLKGVSPTFGFFSGGTVSGYLDKATFVAAVVPTPEPSSYLTLGTALIGLSLIARRRRS